MLTDELRGRSNYPIGDRLVECHDKAAAEEV
jgi:hypothetical protein